MYDSIPAVLDASVLSRITVQATLIEAYKRNHSLCTLYWGSQTLTQVSSLLSRRRMPTDLIQRIMSNIGTYPEAIVQMSAAVYATDEPIQVAKAVGAEKLITMYPGQYSTQSLREANVELQTADDFLMELVGISRHRLRSVIRTMVNRHNPTSVTSIAVRNSGTISRLQLDNVPLFAQAVSEAFPT